MRKQLEVPLQHNRKSIDKERKRAKLVDREIKKIIDL